MIKFILALLLPLPLLAASTHQLIEEVRGLVMTTPAFEEHREKMELVLDNLEQFGVVQSPGSDESMRPIFVNLQGSVEQTLTRMVARGAIAVSAIIHTPTPATPCCLEGKVNSGLVVPDIERDRARVYTVESRAAIIRSYLAVGGRLLVVYPRSGLELRSAEQQAIYRSLLTTYPDELVDCPIDCEQLDGDLIGATYLFQDQAGHWFAFGIRAPQTNAPDDQHIWALWLGPLSLPVVQERVNRVRSFLSNYSIDF